MLALIAYRRFHDINRHCPMCVLSHERETSGKLIIADECVVMKLRGRMFGPVNRMHSKDEEWSVLAEAPGLRLKNMSILMNLQKATK